MAKGITSSSRSKGIWGVKTKQRTKVKSVVLSPNHWNGAVGNKHWFFILDACLNPEPVRGVYNEVLRTDLEQHRKVFEVLGNRMKCEPVPQQMSGVGFSETIPATLLVTVDGGRSYNVKFGH